MLRFVRLQKMMSVAAREKHCIFTCAKTPEGDSDANDRPTRRFIAESNRCVRIDTRIAIREIAEDVRSSVSSDLRFHSTIHAILQVETKS